MAQLTAKERSNLPDRSFAYVDSRGKRLLPINDESHVRNALARFSQVDFESEAAREKARIRLLKAAHGYGIMPVGFITRQIRSERGNAVTSSQRNAPDLPVGFVTLLLTDIEGSTRLIRELGDGYEAPLEETRRIIRDNVSQAGGREVDIVADESFSVFEEPGDAIRAAIDIQMIMRDTGWPDGLEFRVRAGIHSGTVKMTSSGYLGVVIHKAARVCSAAHGGQVVASEETKDALGRSTPANVGFQSLGAHRLAGLPEAHELFQLRVDGLQPDFPELRT